VSQVVVLDLDGQTLGFDLQIQILTKTIRKGEAKPETEASQPLSRATNTVPGTLEVKMFLAVTLR